jgi:hypothetical protein
VFGGGIFVGSGALTLLSSSVTSNGSQGGKGGAGGPGGDIPTAVDIGQGGQGGQGGLGAGGGLYISNGTANLFSSSVSANQARGGDGEAGAQGAQFLAAQVGSQGVGPDSGGAGGAALGGGLNVNLATVTLVDSHLDANRAVGGNGGRGPDAFVITPPGSNLPWYYSAGAGGPGGPAQGGALYESGPGISAQQTSGATVTLFGSSMDRNSATGGKGNAGGDNAGHGLPVLFATPAGGAGGAGGDGSGGAIFLAGGAASDFDGSISANNATGGNAGNGGSGGAGGIGGAGGGGAGGGAGAGAGGAAYVAGGSLTLTSATMATDNARGGDGGLGGPGGPGYVGYNASPGGAGGAGGNAGGAYGGAAYLSDGELSVGAISACQAVGGNGGPGGQGAPGFFGGPSGAGGGGGTGGDAKGGAVYVTDGHSVSVWGEPLNCKTDAGPGGVPGPGGAPSAGPSGVPGPGGAPGQPGAAGQAGADLIAGQQQPVAVSTTHLVISPLPPSLDAGAPFPYRVYVVAEDANGNVDPTFASKVMVSLFDNPNPAQGVLGGTLTVNAANGVATFSDLQVDKGGDGYSLQATSGGLPNGTASALTNPFQVLGYTPAQIRTAYGLNSLPFEADGQLLDGTGQTIAIVDAYDAPGLFADVDHFDREFGRTSSGESLYQEYGSATSFLTVLNQNGQSAPLPVTAGSLNPDHVWQTEETEDVEWAHALAPGAKIILIECNDAPDKTTLLANLMAGVTTAGAQAGVSVVSMSWGLPEGSYVTKTMEQSYDNAFTARGVTYIAITGDKGAPSEYPAYSPNVLAVGGTSLLLGTNGSYEGETGWSDSGGGFSDFEGQPSYQAGLGLVAGMRAVPDVSFAANAATGVAVFDSFEVPPDRAWATVAGTSLGAPSWAALIALVNQGRAAAHEPVFNNSGPTEAQSALYDLPAHDFHDITADDVASGNGSFRSRPGYDLVTGLGTPVAAYTTASGVVKGLVPDLIAFGGPVKQDPTFPPGVVGVPYTQTITVSGGVGHKTLNFNVTAGAIPAGLHFTPTTSELDISGTPTAPGSVTFAVTATDANGHSDTETYSFTINPAAPPTVTAISPSSGPLAGGTQVTITGTGLYGAAAVNFGAAAGTIISDSPTQVVAMAPAGAAGTMDVTVMTANGTSATSAADQFIYVAPPSVTGLDQPSGPPAGGTTVTITGSNLANATAVYFGSTPATIISDSTTQLVVTSPAEQLGNVDVTVTTVGGRSPISAGDLFRYVAAPTVTAIRPAGGAVAGGTTVTIYGADLRDATAIHFGSTPGTIVADYGTELVATSPAGMLGTVDLTVTTPGGTATAGPFTYAAAPTVTGISAAAGSTLGGTTLTITGTNLANATAVHFKGTFGNGSGTIVSDTDTQIVVTSPPGFGTVDVQVDTPAGTSATSAADQFTYVAPPEFLFGYNSPRTGPVAGGTQVTMYATDGTHLANATAVNFGSVPGTIVSDTDTQIVAISPPGAPGTVDVTVTTAGGTSPTGPADYFTYGAGVVPTVTGISPATGGSSFFNRVTITGTNLADSSGTTVYFGKNRAQVVSYSLAQIVVESPPAAPGTVDVTVHTGGGTSATTAADQFTYVAAPTVTGITPVAGPTTGGTTVTITGTNLLGATAVLFSGGVAGTIVTDSATQVVVITPALSAGASDVTVKTPGGISAESAADVFTDVPVPAVTGLSPASGPVTGGTQVTITGTGLANATAVNFGGAAGTIVSNSDTKIVATSPAGVAGTVDVTVTTAGGTSATVVGDQFTYGAGAAPTVTGISPAAGPVAGGTKVTITGTNFAGGTAPKVFFGAAQATVTSFSLTQIVATSPPGAAGTVDITVTAAGGTSPTSAADQFSYAGTPTVTRLSPASGLPAGGTQVTITGTNLAGATAVYFGSAVGTIVSDSATQIVATSPADLPGTVDVTVTTAGGTSATSPADQFTYIPVPVVTGVAPVPGGPMGGGTWVLITGTDLAGATAVQFGSAAGKIVSNTAAQIVAISPTGTGPVDITVTNRGGTSATSAADQFRYVAAPSVTAISPAEGPAAGGTEVTISGSDLDNAMAVAFGPNLVTSFVSDTAGQLVVNSPAGSGTVNVTVITAGGTSATSPADRFSYPAAPMVTADPTGATVAAGATVTFTAAASGSPAPTVQWQVSTDGGNTFTDLPGATSATLRFTATADANGNKYRAVFTNSGGTATSAAATLEITAGTGITLNSDHSLGAVYGETVTVTAAVTAEAATFGTPTGSVQFVVDGTNVGVPVTLSGGSASLTLPALAAGDHNVTATYTSDSSNFAGATTTSPLVQSTSAAPLTITANNQSKVSGAPLPALTASYRGLVNGDTPAVFASPGNHAPVLATTATQTSPAIAGGYPITVGGAADPDYTIDYISGTLTVVPASAPAPLPSTGQTGTPSVPLAPAPPPITLTVVGGSRLAVTSTQTGQVLLSIRLDFGNRRLVNALVTTDSNGLPDVVFVLWDKHSHKLRMVRLDGAVLLRIAARVGRPPNSAVAAVLEPDGFLQVLVATDPKGQPVIDIFSGRTGKVLRQFSPFPPGIQGTVHLSMAEVNGDGILDLVVTDPESGQTEAVVFDGRSLLASLPRVVS